MGALLGILVLFASVLLIILAARSFYLSSKFKELETRLDGLERRQREMRSTATPVIDSAAASTPATRTAAPLTTVNEAEREDPTPIAIPTTTVPPQITRIPATPSRTREEWEALIGGKLLNRIGALALIIGVGFFLKHAFDNEWISETVRVLIGAAAGFICLLGANRTHKRGYHVFSQGIVGAGIAILYLSAYALFNFYHLVSLPVAFVLMAAVTVIAFLEALRYDSMAVSVLACVGGLLTPFMLSTGESNETGLFSYLVLLNMGVVFVLIRKSAWILLDLLMLFGTYLLYFSWFRTYYTPDDTLLTLIFLVLFWAIFHGLDMFRAFTATDPYADQRRFLAWIHAAVFFGALFALVDPHFHTQMGIVAAGASALYFGSMGLLEWSRPAAKPAIIQYALTGVIFLALAIAIEFERFDIVILWTIEAGALVWAGTRFQRVHLWIAGLVLLGVTAFTLLGTDGSLDAEPIEHFRLILSTRTLAYVLLALALAGSVYLMRTVKSRSTAILMESLHYGWVLLLFILFTVETCDLFRSWMVNVNDLGKDILGFTRLMVLAGVWSLYSLALSAVGAQTYIRPIVFSGIGIALAAACLAGIRGIAFDPLEAFTPVFNIRVSAILLTVLTIVIVYRWIGHSVERSKWIPEVRRMLQIIGVLLLLVLFTGETRDMFEKEIQSTAIMANQSAYSEEVTRLKNLEQLSLSGLWLVFSIGLMGLGIWRRARTLRLLAIVLVGFTILKIFIYDLSFLETLYRIFSFVALGLILLAVSYLYQKYRTVILGPSPEERT